MRTFELFIVAIIAIGSFQIGFNHGKKSNLNLVFEANKRTSEVDNICREKLAMYFNIKPLDE